MREATQPEKMVQRKVPVPRVGGVESQTLAMYETFGTTTLQSTLDAAANQKEQVVSGQVPHRASRDAETERKGL